MKNQLPNKFLNWYYIVVTNPAHRLHHLIHLLRHQKKWKKNVINFKNINWLGGNILPKGLDCSAKIRSTQEDLPGILDINSDHGSFTFEKELDKTSPGQACVFYKNDQLLGGGWITA